MKRRTNPHSNCSHLLPSALLAASLIFGATECIQAATYIKADNTTALNASGSWTTTGVPGGGDTAQWDNTFETINNNAALGGAMTWSGIVFSNNLQASFTINATGTNILTIGAGGILMSNANQSLTINAPLTIGGNETWNIASGQALTLGGTVNGGSTSVNNTYNHTITGYGVVNFNGSYADGGNAGQLMLINSNATVNINPGATGSFVSFKKFAVGNDTGSATLNILSGTNLIAPTNYLVFADNTSTATLNISGGQTTLSPTTYPFCVALKGTGVVNVASSVLAIGPSAIVSIGSYSASGSGTVANGALNINNGGVVIVTNSPQIFAIGNGSGTSWYGTGYLNLNNGGTLVSGRNIIKNNSSAKGYVYFNGGMLVAATNSAAFMQGLTAATISTNGATISDGGFAVTIAQPLLHDPTLVADGGLVKLGSGTLTLAATNTYNGGTTVKAGTLIIPAAAASAPGNYTLGTGGGLTVAAGAVGASMGMNALTLNAGTTLTLNETSLAAPLLEVTNALTTAATVTLNLTNMTISPGDYPLISYGSLGGSGVAGFVLGSVPVAVGVNLSLSNNVANHSVDLVVTTATTVTWNGNVNGIWDIGGTPNWQGGQYYTQSGGVGPAVTFDDTASGTTAITLNTTVSPNGIVYNNSSQTYSLGGSGQISGAGALIKNGSGTLTLATANTFTNLTSINSGTLQLGDGSANNGSVGGMIIDDAALIVANPNSQTINNLITGNGTLTKSAAGTLTLTSSNTVSGPVSVNAGELVLNSSGAGGTIPVLGSVSNLSILSGATLALNGANAFGYSNSLTPIVAVAGGGTLSAIGSGTHYMGNLNLGDSSAGGSLTGSGTIVVNGNVTNASTSVVSVGSLTCNGTNIFMSAGSSLTITSNLNLTYSTSIGEIIFGDPNNGPGTFTTMGNITCTTPYLELEYVSWNADLGTNQMVMNSKITIGKIPGLPAYLEWNSGTGLIAYNNFFTIADAIGNNNQSVGELDVNGGSLVISNNTSRCLLGNAGTATIDVAGGTLSFLGNNTIQLGGDTTYPQNGASGTLNVNSGMMVVGPQSGGLRLAADKGTFTGITGTVNLNGGNLTTWPGIINGATGSGQSAINFNGGVLQAGTNNPIFLQGLSQATVQSGGAVISDGGWRIMIGQGLQTDGTGGGLTKLGTGTLILTNTSVYTGETVVSNGTLEVDGALPASSVVVASGASLSGFGQLGENVTVEAGGNLMAGTNGVPGMLTVDGNLSLAGSLAVNVNKGLALSSSVVEVTGGITNLGSGVVVVTNAGPALVIGDSFQLFSQPVQNGGALSIASEGGVTWSNRLAIDGTIQVLTVTPPINPLPGSIQVSVSGGILSLAWPTNSGWILQAQTNALATGLGTNWTAVAGSASVTNLTMPVNPLTGAVFYRMVHP